MLSRHHPSPCSSAVLWCAVLTFLGASNTAGLTTDDVLFHASFDGSADATFARGSETAKCRTPLKFTKGILGQAVIVGEAVKEKGDASLSPLGYEIPGNMLREEGSVAFWAQAVDWHTPDGKNHQFLTIPGNPVTYHFYVYYPGNTWWLLLKKGGNRPVGSSTPQWRPGEWHHLVATWRQGEMTVFVDGRQKARATEDVPLTAELRDRFWLGKFDEFKTAFDDLTIFRKVLSASEVAALYGKAAHPPPPATAIVGDNPAKPTQVAGLLDDLTGQVILDEDVTAQLWADSATLHVTLRWAVPDYFRRDPTAYGGRCLRRGAPRPVDNDSFEVRAGRFHVLVSPDGLPCAKSRIGMDEWVVELDIPRKELGGETFGFEFSRRWRELRRLSASWRGRLTIQPGAKTAQVHTEDVRKLAAAAPDDLSTDLLLEVPGCYEAHLPFVRPTPFKFELQHFPSAGKLVVNVSKPSATVALAGEAKSGATELTFDVSKLSAGSHDIKVTLDGTSKSLLFKKEPTTEWNTAKTGVSADVPPPWSPLAVATHRPTIKCWGREYDFGALFPTQVSSQGNPLLAAPMCLKAGALIAQGQTHMVEAKPAVVKLAGRGTLGTVAVEVQTQLEFDGYIWFDVNLTPVAGSETRLESLAFEIPMKVERATLFYSGSYTAEGTGKLAKDGYQGAWRHLFWVGDEDAGIQWFAESAQGWRITRQDRALTIRDGLIHLAIADAPFTLKQPLAVSFGIMATPVRPRPKEWRTWRFPAPNDSKLNGRRDIMLWNKDWGTRWNYPVLKSNTADRLRKKYMRGEIPCLYASPTTIAPNTPEYRYWQDEWRVSPSSRVDFASLNEQDENAYTSVCPRSTFTNFYCWSLGRAIKAADIRALYFDVSNPPRCRNEAHGCGWRDTYGKLHETVALRATREFHKRVYMVGKQHRPDFLVAIHMSGNVLMPQLSFSDIMIDGENFTGVLLQQWVKEKRGDYFHLLTLDKMRAEFMLHNFGPVPAFLPELGRALGKQWMSDQPAALRAAQHLVGLFALHDAPMWQAYLPAEALDRLWKAQARFGWDEQVEFIPYWRSQRFLQLAPGNSDLVASVFRRPDRVMILVMNNADRNLEVYLDLNADELRLRGMPLAQIEDLYSGRTWLLDGGQPRPIPISARSFRMLVPQQHLRQVK